MNSLYSILYENGIVISIGCAIITVVSAGIPVYNKLKDKKLKMPVIIILIVVAVIGILIIVASLIVYNCMVSVPDVSSMSIDNAVQTLRELKFDVQPYQDANFENHMNDAVLFQSDEAGQYVWKGKTIYISYEQIIYNDESNDSSSSDEITISDETSSSNISFSTSSESTPEIDLIPISYNHSANIVNGGFCCYDGNQYYFGDINLKKIESLSGGNQTTIYNGSVYYLNPVGDYLYFTTPNENNSICRIKKNGNDFEILYDKPCHELTYYKDYLYFCRKMGDDNFQICRMSLDDTADDYLDVVELYACREWYMSIYNDKIFFCNYDDNQNIYMMGLDGSNCMCIYEGECYDLCIVNDKIYFSQGSQLRQLYYIKISDININDNKQYPKPTLLRDSYTIYTNCRGDKLYYVDSNGLLCKCNLNGTQSEIVYNVSSYSFVVLLPDNVICSYDRNLEKNITFLEI